MFYDKWFPAYFVKQKGKYIDNIEHPGNVLNHGEMYDEELEVNNDYWAETNEQNYAST
jgi:hypothetical protein